MNEDWVTVINWGGRFVIVVVARGEQRGGCEQQEIEAFHNLKNLNSWLLICTGIIDELFVVREIEVLRITFVAVVFIVKYRSVGNVEYLCRIVSVATTSPTEVAVVQCAALIVFGYENQTGILLYRSGLFAEAVDQPGMSRMLVIRRSACGPDGTPVQNHVVNGIRVVGA